MHNWAASITLGAAAEGMFPGAERFDTWKKILESSDADGSLRKYLHPNFVINWLKHSNEPGDRREIFPGLARLTIVGALVRLQGSGVDLSDVEVVEFAAWTRAESSCSLPPPKRLFRREPPAA